MPSDFLSQPRIDHEDVVARFDKVYPELGLESHHSSLLLKIFMELGQSSGVNSYKTACAFCNTTSHPQHQETPTVSTDSRPIAERQPPGMTRMSNECAIRLINKFIQMMIFCLTDNFSHVPLRQFPSPRDWIIRTTLYVPGDRILSVHISDRCRSFVH